MKKKIAVIGQGPSGCTAAYVLDKLEGPNVDIHFLGQDFAGRASTIDLEDVHLDLGASLLTDTYKLIPSLIRDLGLSASLVPFKPTATVRRDYDGAIGTLTLNDPASLLSYPLLSVGQKLRLVRPLLYLSAIGLLPGFDPMSLDSVARIDGPRSMERYFQDEIGQEALDNLGVPFAGLFRAGVGGIPEATFKAWFTRPAVEFRAMVKGMGAIWSAIRTRIAARHTVKSGVTVTHVARAAAPGVGYTVDLTDGGVPRKEDYDAVVLALPATQINAVSGGLLSPVVQATLAERTYAEGIVGIFRVSVPKSTPYAQGLLFPCGPAKHDIAVVHLHRRHKLGQLGAVEDFASVYTTDRFAASLAGSPDSTALDALYASVQKELRGTTSWIASAPLEKIRLARYRYATLSYPSHARPSVRSQQLAATQVGSLLQLAGGFTEQPVADCMETAARSGEKAAKRLLSTLFGRTY